MKFNHFTFRTELAIIDYFKEFNQVNALKVSRNSKNSTRMNETVYCFWVFHDKTKTIPEKKTRNEMFQNYKLKTNIYIFDHLHLHDL